MNSGQPHKSPTAFKETSAWLIAPICPPRLFSKSSKEGRPCHFTDFREMGGEKQQQKGYPSFSSSPRGVQAQRLGPAPSPLGKARDSAGRSGAGSPAAASVRRKVLAPRPGGSREPPQRRAGRGAGGAAGRARERKVPSGTRAGAGTRAANEAPGWAVRGGGTGRIAAFAVAAAGAAGAGGEAAAERPADRAPRPGPGGGESRRRLETFPAGNSRRPAAAAAGLRAPRAGPHAAVPRRERVPGGREGDGESGKACGKVSGARPPFLGAPGSFPGTGTDMLGTPGLGAGGSGASAPPLRHPLRAGQRCLRRSWDSGGSGKAGGTLGFRDHPYPASSTPFSPPL